MQAVSEAGGIAMVLPAHGFADDAHALLERLDGVLFSGGPDIDPALYGHLPDPNLGPNVDRIADEYELKLVEAARELDMPVLAICRGMQALNVQAGGTLHQHLPDRTDLDHRPEQPPHEAAHAVIAAAGSPLHQITGRRRLHVNSVHHQAIDDLGSGLEVIAAAADGVIEAIHAPANRFCLGVQWHAELLTHREEHAPVIEALVHAAGGQRVLKIAA